jgi:hypothetical protein
MTRVCILLLLAGTAATLALAGACGGGHSPAATRQQSGRHVWLSFAACLRAHGANEPDPTFDQDGNPQWAIEPKNLPSDATDACGSILQAASLQRRPAPTAAQLARLTQYAQCLRQHGVADFPDPDPQTGSYPTTSDPTKEAAFPAAQQACRQLAPPASK